MKLTLQQYLNGRITGHFPGESKPDRPLDDRETRIVATECATAFCVIGAPTNKMDVTAISLTQEPEGVVGVFKNEGGQIFTGTWDGVLKAFIGVRIPVPTIDPVEVEYQTTLTVLPIGAIEVACEGWGEKACPIYLSNGRPTRYVNALNAGQFSWRKIHNGSYAWVQDSD